MRGGKVFKCGNRGKRGSRGRSPGTLDRDRVYLEANRPEQIIDRYGKRQTREFL